MISNIIKEEKFVSKWVGIEYKLCKEYQEYLKKVYLLQENHRRKSNKMLVR